MYNHDLITLRITDDVQQLFLNFSQLSFPQLSSPKLSFYQLSFPQLSSPKLSFYQLSFPQLSSPQLSFSKLSFSSCHFLISHFISCQFFLDITSGSNQRVGIQSVQAEWAVRSGRCLEILLLAATMQVPVSSFPSPASPSPRWPLIRPRQTRVAGPPSYFSQQVQSAKDCPVRAEGQLNS
jgi:hypothetical protein